MSTYPGMRGWTCAYCGFFVSEGCAHYCLTSPAYSPPSSPATKLDPTFQYLALAERLVAALELLAERVAELEHEANK